METLSQRLRQTLSQARARNGGVAPANAVAASAGGGGGGGSAGTAVQYTAGATAPGPLPAVTVPTPLHTSMMSTAGGMPFSSQIGLPNSAPPVSPVGFMANASAGLDSIHRPAPVCLSMLLLSLFLLLFHFFFE